jgi:hypothetical protein
MDSDAKKYKVKDVLAIKEFNLPPKSLDMEALRKQFCRLANIPFEGYENERPVLLIGTEHAHLMEGCEMVEDAGDGPIAVRNKIGWSVYGGMTQVNKKRELNVVSNLVSELSEGDEQRNSEGETPKVSNEQLHALLVKHYSIESLGIRAVRESLY